jgi:diaminopimelate epimerase
MKTYQFTKMEGAGNDYIYMYNPTPVPTGSTLKNLIIKISNRHFGVGSDGLVFILKSKTCDFRMRMFN